MTKTNINYPHPVLSAANDDYVNSKFDIELINDPTVKGENAVISIRYILDCDGLLEMLRQHKAEVVLFIESPISEYRKIERFPSDCMEKTILIKKDMLNKSVSLKGYIIACDELRCFSLPEHNKSYFGSVPFNIRKGDILGIASHQYNIPLQSYDPLADRPSIFCIRRQLKDPKEEVSADFSDDKISIFLNDDTYKKYQELYSAPDVRLVLASFFAAPVLVDVLHFMKHMNKEEQDVYACKKWYQVITYRLKELKIDLDIEESLTKVANAILPHIFASSITALTELCKELLKEGEYE